MFGHYLELYEQTFNLRPGTCILCKIDKNWVSLFGVCKECREKACHNPELEKKQKNQLVVDHVVRTLKAVIDTDEFDNQAIKQFANDLLVQIGDFVETDKIV